jgi:hypothetical protein
MRQHRSLLIEHHGHAGRVDIAIIDAYATPEDAFRYEAGFFIRCYGAVIVCVHREFDANEVLLPSLFQKTQPVTRIGTTGGNIAGRQPCRPKKYQASIDIG